jgi:hypothetical protein
MVIRSLPASSNSACTSIPLQGVSGALAVRVRIMTDPVRVGDVFTGAEGPRSAWDEPSDAVVWVCLRVEEIRYFGHPIIEELQAPHAAELLQSGPGATRGNLRRQDVRVPLAFDEPPTVQEQDCPRCGRHYPLIKAFVTQDAVATAVTFTSLHCHDGDNEAWIDAILGTFGEDRSEDHVTFGCRVGSVMNADEPQATLVAAAQPYGDSEIWGQKLNRDAALQHARLAQFWEIVDFVLVADPVVHHHVYGHDPSN